MSEQEQNRINEQETVESTEKKESTFGGIHSCLSYDRYVQRLEKKKKGCKRSKLLWLALALGIVTVAAVSVWLLLL